MLIDIIWNDDVTRVDLADGTVSVGGGGKDHIHLDGLPHGLLTLTLLGEQLSVTAQRSFRVGQALFPARIPRLVVADEALKLPNDVIIRRVVDSEARAQRKAIDTAFVVEELLGAPAPVERTRAPTFICVTGLDQGRVFAIPYEENSIGRADDAVVRVRDRAVSRRQATLRKQGREFVLESSSPLNAAYVNGVKLKAPRALKTGDTVELGHTVLRFDAGERAATEHTVLMAHAPALEPGSAPEPVPAPLAAEPAPSFAPEPPRAHVGPELALMAVGVSFTLLGMAIAALLVG